MLAAPNSVVLCLFATVEQLSTPVVHIRFSTATVDDRWESEYLAASQAAAGMIPFGDKIRDKYLRCIIGISVIPSGSDTMSSHIYIYIHIVGWVNKNHWHFERPEFPQGTFGAPWF